jgi:4-amino-4-deoxy-L-arabinose transferase-like glycosyltransferase
MILLTLMFGVVVLLFARDLGGAAAAVAALAVYSFSTDVLAHGSLATLDVPVAGFLLTALWLLWRARFRPALYLPLAGLAAGAALATKMNALAAVPVLLLLAALAIWPRRIRACAAAVAGVAVIAVSVVWLSYLLVDPRMRWAAPLDLPHLTGLRAALIDVLPFPPAYRDGMRVQFGFEDESFGGFLWGEAYPGSRWYYLPAALLVKMPLGMIALWLIGAVVLLARRRLRPAAPYVLLVPVVMLLATMGGSRDFGVRYVIVWPVVLAVAAGLAVHIGRARILAAGLVLFVAVSSMRTFPHYLTYSNEAFGGPSLTYQWLHDSNVDWGQDLGRLADRLRERYPGQPVWLEYKGNGVPAAYGIVGGDPLRVPPERVRGLLVVSRTLVAQPDGQLRALIDTSTPIDQVGNSITIYRR